MVVEVNCETDFVARGPKFQELVKDLAMQVAACPAVTVVAVEDVPAAELENERRIEMEKEDIKSKPEAMRYGTTLPPRSHTSPACDYAGHQLLISE